MIILEKALSWELVKYLWHHEFRCRCHYVSCTATLIDEDLLQAYEKFRKAVGLPCIISSGYRCPQHNKDIGGKPLSRHQTGQAIDISYRTLKDKFTVDEIIKLARASGFTFVKFYKGRLSFFHMDVRKQ